MRGLTLIEILVYLGLFSILMLGFISATAAIGEASQRISAQSLLLDEENFLLQRIRHHAEYASSIEVGGTAPRSSLLLEVESAETLLYIEDGNLAEERSDTKGALNNNQLEVRDFDCDVINRENLYSVSCILATIITSRAGTRQGASTSLKLYPLNL